LIEMRKLYSLNAPYDGLGQQFRLTPLEEWGANYSAFVTGIDSREDYERLFSGYDEGKYHRALLHSLYGQSSKILVLGAGNGLSDYDFYTAYPDKEISLSDISDGVLRKISPFYGFRAMKIDSRNITLPDGSHDLVYTLASEYFFSDSDYLRMLSEAARVLKPGGHLLVSTVCLEEPRKATLKGSVLGVISERPLLWVLVNKLRGINLKWTGYIRSLDDHAGVLSRVDGLKLERVELDYGSTGGKLKSTAFLLRKRYGS